VLGGPFLVHCGPTTTLSILEGILDRAPNCYRSSFGALSGDVLLKLASRTGMSNEKAL